MFLLPLLFPGLKPASFHQVFRISTVLSPTALPSNQIVKDLDSQRDDPGQNPSPEPKAAFYKIACSDCEYFTQELEEMYHTNIDDIEILGYILEQLKTKGCLENDPTIKMIQARFDALKAGIVQEDDPEPFSADEVDRLVKEGNAHEAIRLLEVAIERETDSLRKGMHFLQIANIQYKELKDFPEARKNAYRATELASREGKTYLLLGDIYLSMSRNCGESWQERLAAVAAIEKYEHARNIDSTVVIEANRRILNLGGSLPLREDGFLRQVNPGDKVLVGCGINETITVRFQ